MRYTRIGLVGSLAYLGTYDMLAHQISGHANAVPVPEDQSSSNTSYTTHTDESCRAECTFPLTTDVVGLVRHDSGHVAVGSSSGQKYAWGMLVRFFSRMRTGGHRQICNSDILPTRHHAQDRMPLTEVSDTSARVETHD
jgi:hypothetical protein